MKKIIISTLLCLSMILSLIPTVPAQAVGNHQISVYVEGSPLEQVVLPQNGKVELTAVHEKSGSADYQWQIYAGDEVWVDIAGEDNTSLDLSYAMIANMLLDDEAKVRCKATGDDADDYSSEIKVRMDYKTLPEFEAAKVIDPKDLVITEAKSVGEAVITPPLKNNTAEEAAAAATYKDALSASQSAETAVDEAARVLAEAEAARIDAEKAAPELDAAISAEAAAQKAKNDALTASQNAEKAVDDAATILAQAEAARIDADKTEVGLEAATAEAAAALTTYNEVLSVSQRADQAVEEAEEILAQAEAARIDAKEATLGVEAAKSLEASAQKTYKDALSASQSADKAVEDAVPSPLSDSLTGTMNQADLTTYSIIINYIYANGVQAANSWTATVASGTNYSGNVVSPTVVGYTPSSSTVDLNFTNITQDKTINVTYAPALVNYKVIHYRQNITDDLYTNYVEETKQGYTESAVGSNLAKSYPGFFSLKYDETVKIVADGSTIVEIYYDRYYYLMNFNLNGGYGVEPIYARFGSSISVGNPTRAGYTFNGWNPAVPNTVPVQNSTYTAQWTAKTGVSYTLVYWVENANDTGYTFHSSSPKSNGQAGQKVPVLTTADKKTITYFTYKQYDSETLIAGDGSTIINVYYSRNSYTVRFDLNLTNAKLNINNRTYNDSNNSTNWYSFTAKYDSDISAKWPTATNIPSVGQNNFYGWPANSTIYVSKRLTFTDDLINADGTTRTFTGSWTISDVQYDLNYMFESLTNQGDKLYNGTWYIEDQSYSQLAYSSGNWSAKQISGASSIAVVTDGTQLGDGDYDVYFYYTYKSYTLNFYNYNANVPGKGGSVKYTAPLSSYQFSPAYPSTLEPNAYQFAGWYTIPGTFEGSEVNWETIKMPANNVTLYAKWVPVTRTVKIYLTEGSVIGGSPLNTWSVTHGSSVPTAPDNPTNGQYTFVGWFYKEDNAEKAFDFSMPVRKDLNLYAKWSSNVLMNYTIRFQLADGTPVANPITGTTLAGNTKTFDAKGGTDLFAAYQTGYFPTTNSHSITLDITDQTKNEYTFIYKPMASVAYTVRYLEVGTNAVLLPEKSTSTTSAVVTENFQTKTGYMPDAYQKRLVVSSELTQNVITFWYVKDTTHAPVQVVHYVQNIVGSEYTTYQTTTDLNGIIGQNYSVNALNIDGFTYGSSKVNGVMTALVQNKLTGTIQTSGLLLEIYYDRINYPYEFRFLRQGTSAELASKVTGTARIESQVTQDPKVIPGYFTSTNTQAMTIQRETGSTAVNNVKTFYYQEQQVLVKYEAVGPTGATNFGSLDRSSENLPVITGNALGSTPTAQAGYRFMGWYKDAALTEPVGETGWVTGNKLIPQKTKDYDDSTAEKLGYEAATYYAKFDYDLADLTITKTGANPIDENQSFIFTVKGDSPTTAGIELKVVINMSSGQTQGSKTIKDLPVGQYAITEADGWSWRYTPDSTNKGINLHPTNPNTVPFSNTRTLLKWLNGASYTNNKFNAVGN